MGTKAAGRMGWTRGNDGASEKGQRDVQPVAHKKDEGCDFGKALTLIDCPHQDNLPVQPVAQRPGIERY
jgi:hypothetical protein